MVRKIRNLFEVDWCAELTDNERAVRKERGESIEVVFLAGLQRLAREAGIVSQSVEILTPSSEMIQAIFTSVFLVEFAPGEFREVTFVGTADCNARNTTKQFLGYPTAVAESRAEARSLRKALGIRMLSSEEIGFREGASSIEASPNAKVAGNVVAAIETLCNTRGVEIAEVLDHVLEESRATSVFELSELTAEEAQSAMSWLNEQKPKTDARSARKDELKRKLKNG